MSFWSSRASRHPARHSPKSTPGMLRHTQAESSSSRHTSESGGAEGEPSTLTQGDSSTSAEQEASQGPPAEQAEASPATGVEEAQPPVAPSTGRPLSPRQRRAQQHSQQGQRDDREPASRPVFAPAPRQPHDESHAGSVVLIVVLTLALAALIFRRIYLAHEYKFDYEL